jgi:hypothetical protein
MGDVAIRGEPAGRGETRGAEDRNLHGYRAMLAPHIKRRLVAEPEVAKYIKVDPPEFKVNTVQWDREHLAVYLRAADEFADWYRQSRSDSKACNLVTILARIPRCTSPPTIRSLGWRVFLV